MLDGIDNNTKIVDLQNSSPVVIQPSVDALQEFRIETNNYSAQYGYSAGAVVNATIKSGTNQIHGDAFEFLRNSEADARNFFLPARSKHLSTSAINLVERSVVPSKEIRYFYSAAMKALG